jgi:AcrR family transcriptional regulator
MANSPAEINTPKVDRRVQRTRNALRIALMELVQEKDYDLISVEEVAERADVSRATFYLHFHDKEDLLMEEFYRMAKERVQVYSELPASVWVTVVGADDSVGQPVMPLLKIFEHALENARLYRILLRPDSSRRLVDGIRQITTQAFNEFLNTKFQNELLELHPAVPVDLLSAYFSATLMSTMGWWLEQESRISPEEVTRMFHVLFFPGIKKAFGLENMPR